MPLFEPVVANVGEMVRTRRELGSTTPRISIWMTGMRENLRELPDVVDLAARLGVEEVYLQRLVFWGEGLATARAEHLFGQRDEVEAIIAEAERRAERQGVTLARRRRAESAGESARTTADRPSPGERAVDRCDWPTSPPRARRCRAASRRLPTRRSRA